MAQGLKRPGRKLPIQRSRETQTGNDVKLSNVARALGEGIALIKAETRLSRKIRKEDWTSGINQRLIEQGACRIGANTVSALDIADVGQPYSKKMDHLSEVRDGSTGKKGSARYRMTEVIAALVQ